MAEVASNANRLATVFGGSGFIGRHIVRALARQGWRVRVAVRRPDLANFLQPLGGVGQVMSVQANLRYPASIRAALAGADVVVNATGIHRESGRQNYEAVHVFGAAQVAEASAKAGVASLVHVSGIGADAQSENAYIASKGRGEAAARAAFPDLVVLRPSVVFGPEDDFFNRFAALARVLPVLPLFGGGESKLQPVFVGDVAKAAYAALTGAVRAGAVYELGGPQVMTLREVAEYALATTDRRRALAPLPLGLSKAIARGAEIASALSLGLFPAPFATTRDEVELLRLDNIVSPQAIAEGRTLQGLGVEPQGVEAIVPSYLYRFRKTGQFASSGSV